jgi:hypothetical protein
MGQPSRLNLGANDVRELPVGRHGRSLINPPGIHAVMTHRAVNVLDNRYDHNDQHELDDLYKFLYHAIMPPHLDQQGNRRARSAVPDGAPPPDDRALPPDTPGLSAGAGGGGPSPARVYAYWLGGADHDEADRQAAEEVIRVRPEVVAGVRGNRAFGRRVAWHAAYGFGIRQFLHIGAGLPAPGATHHVAQQASRSCRVVYADNDPVVVALGDAAMAARRAGTGCCGYVHADVRAPASVIAAAAGNGLDFARPVAVLLLAVLHFVADADDPAGIVAELAAVLAPGSLVAISHLTADYAPGPVTAGTATYNARVPVSLYPRDRAQVTGLFGALPGWWPGVVPVTRWQPSFQDTPAPPVDMYGGMSRPRPAICAALRPASSPPRPQAPCPMTWPNCVPARLPGRGTRHRHLPAGPRPGADWAGTLPDADSSGLHEAELVALRVCQRQVSLVPCGDAGAKSGEPGDLAVQLGGEQIEVQPILHQLVFGNALQEQARARSFDQDRRVVLEVMDADGGEAGNLFLVVGRHGVPVECSRPETGQRGGMAAVNDDVAKSCHPAIIGAPRMSDPDRTTSGKTRFW